MGIPIEHMVNLMDNGMSAREIAENYGYASPETIRGMVSRFKRALPKIKEVVDHKPISVDPSPSEQRVYDVVIRGQHEFDSWMQQHNGQIVSFLYTSDHHWPYQDDRCISLNIQISALLQPQIITDGSDFFDFDDYSHWQDRRTPAARLWGADIQRPLDLHADYHYQMIKRHKTGPLWVWLWGNHDVWLYEYLMANFNGTSMYTLAGVLEELENHGTVFTGTPSRSHWIKMNDRLKFTHGTMASKNPATVMKNTLEAYASKSWELDAGQYYNVIFGHDHSSGELTLHGVNAYSSGCNCRTDMPYLNSPPNWQHGVVVGHFEVGGTMVDAQRINFYPTSDGSLTCFVNGIQLTS